jgi:hypothetical protein
MAKSVDEKIRSLMADLPDIPEEGWATLDEYRFDNIAAISNLAEMLKARGYDVGDNYTTMSKAITNWMLQLYLIHGDEWRIAAQSVIAKYCGAYSGVYSTGII